ncbi:MAG: hypothetical protein IT163_19785 [Bryobacterales bacterium]|nr:hypothetical protein [Bryobacterales bacterium]
MQRNAFSLTRGVAVLTAAELVQRDQKVECEALDLVRDLSAPKDDPQYHAANKLLSLRPLPAAAVEELLKLTAAPKPSTRQRAAAILAIHQRDSQRCLNAIEQAIVIEKDKLTKAFLLRATEHLKVPIPPLAVLADSDELGRLIEAAVLKAATREGRQTFRMSMAKWSANPVVTGSITPMSEDLPETVSIETSAGASKVALGWSWSISYRDSQPQVSGNQMQYKTSERTLAAVPVGTILRVDEPLRLAKSSIPAGKLLYQTTYGWSVTNPDDLISAQQAQLAIKAPLEKYSYPDIAEVAAIGAAVLGSAGHKLVPAMTGTDDKDRFMFRAVGLGRIGDKSALPTLREWRRKSEGSKGITDAIDKAIAILEK